MSVSERNPALCIRCTSEWRRWVRSRSRELGVNESTLIEMSCSWLAQRSGFPEKSPSIWFPETSPRSVDRDEDRYKDTALYLNVTPEWKSWVIKLSRFHHRSTSWLIEEALRDHALARGASLPPPRTRHFTYALR